MKNMLEFKYTVYLLIESNYLNLNIIRKYFYQ